MVDFGSDVSTFPETDMTGRMVDGRRATAECLLRRYMTPYGSLPYDEDFGCDLRVLLNDDLDDGDLRHLESVASAEALKDERILTASVTMTLNKQESKLSVRIAGTLSDRSSFDFVLAIGNVTAEVLKVN